MTTAVERSEYDDAFYRDRHAMTREAATIILGVVQDHIPRIRSAADVGCGVGTWLSVLKETGAARVAGFDGPWVNRRYLEIPADAFFESDLNEPIRQGERYDLAISLEVAEHISAANAGAIPASLAGLSDFVLFSAAVPGQGGVSHVNEQWPDYWAKLFDEHDYRALDVIRPRVWNDDRISWVYRQNAMLFVKRDRLGDVLRIDTVPEGAPMALVHPELYEAVRAKSIRGSLGDLKGAVRKRLSR